MDAALHARNASACQEGRDSCDYSLLDGPAFQAIDERRARTQLHGLPQPSGVLRPLAADAVRSRRHSGGGPVDAIAPPNAKTDLPR